MAVLAMPPPAAIAPDMRLGELRLIAMQALRAPSLQFETPRQARAQHLHPNHACACTGPSICGEAELMSDAKEVWAGPMDADEDDEVGTVRRTACKFEKHWPSLFTSVFPAFSFVFKVVMTGQLSL